MNPRTLILLAVATMASATSVAVAASQQGQMEAATTSTTTSTTDNTENESSSSSTTTTRQLQAFDFFNIDIDLCDNRDDGADGVPNLERCDLNRFPQCSSNQEICYNRKPSRDQFVPGTHQPVYYIQYDRVMCYPDSWGGCSSCTPGRYCASESRCILDEADYPCARWF